MDDDSKAKVISLEEHRNKSDVAKRLSALKKRVMKAVDKRDSLPRPFFWSLFHSEVDAIRKSKKHSKGEE